VLPIRLYLDNNKNTLGSIGYSKRGSAAHREDDVDLALDAFVSVVRESDI